MNNLEKLLYLSGVSAQYNDYSGQRHDVPFEHRVAALRAMGIDPDNQQAVTQAIFELDAKPWQQWLRPIYVIESPNLVLSFHCHPDKLNEPLTWQLQLENGEINQGQFRPCDLTETGDYYIDGCRYSARQFSLDDHIPSGYHQLTLSDQQSSEQSTLAICPPQCYGSMAQTGADRIWGISCQLYTLRREDNWGIGDFGDLRQLIEHAANVGADMIGLNPLHALCSDDANAVSPYSPSDRRFLNPLYIDVLWAESTLGCANIASLLEASDVKQELNELRELSFIDYQRVNVLKYRGFTALYKDFRDNHLACNSKLAGSFQAFVTKQGQSLTDFCQYETQHNPFSSTFGRDIGFYQFLQWLASEQLISCQQYTQRLGMSIGLMGDLAVGAVGQGCEVSANPDIYLNNITIGAPPDPFTTEGQNWGLPVIDPVKMHQHKFSHFINLLRTNMNNVGGLRVDHAMALMRLWWCLPESSGNGSNSLYVYYPMAQLMALLRLESQRNQCLVVGEDLGVVPPEFREAMRSDGLYSNNLFYFEQHGDHSFKAARHHQTDALLMVTNHDVPPLAQWWSREDIIQRGELGVLTEPEFVAQELEQRNHNKCQLLQWLAEHNALPDGWRLNNIDKAFDAALCEAIHRVNSRSASNLLLIQLEDIQLMATPVNIPGTHLEYPNWRRKQITNTTQLFLNNNALQIFRAVNEERKH